MTKPRSSDAVRHGAGPTAQSTSAIVPHDRHTTWWWLSPTRASYRATEPDGWIRRTSPAVGQGAQHVVDRLVGDRGSAARTTPITESVSACGWVCTAASTASRGPVTRSGAPRSMRS